MDRLSVDNLSNHANTGDHPWPVLHIRRKRSKKRLNMPKGRGGASKLAAVTPGGGSTVPITTRNVAAVSSASPACGVRRRALVTTHAPCDASWITAPRTVSRKRLPTAQRSSTMEYTFTLKYQLADDDRNPDVLVERLGEAGCDDALVGIGQPGRLALEFIREAENADAAVRSALADVRSAVPSARLIEVAPDLVGLTDVAEMVGVSRQNMRKLMLANPGSFPAPVHEGSASIWHLADVLTWLQARGSYSLARDVLEVAQVALQV